MDLRVSVTGGVHFDLVKRVLRDIKRSGQAPEEIIQQVRHPSRSLSFLTHSSSFVTAAAASKQSMAICGTAALLGLMCEAVRQRGC